MWIQHLAVTHVEDLPNIEIGTIADPDVYCDSPSNDLTIEAGSHICNPICLSQLKHKIGT